MGQKKLCERGSLCIHRHGPDLGLRAFAKTETIKGYAYSRLCKRCLEARKKHNAKLSRRTPDDWDSILERKIADDLVRLQIAKMVWWDYCGSGNWDAFARKYSEFIEYNVEPKVIVAALEAIGYWEPKQRISKKA